MSEPADTPAADPATREPASPAELFARLEALGIAAVTHQHPAVFTVEEAEAHCGHLPGGHCKNLLLRDKKSAVIWWSP